MPPKLVSAFSIILLALVTGTLFHPYLFQDRIPLPTDIILALQRDENIWAGESHVQNIYVTDAVVDFFPRAAFTWKARREGYHPNWYPFSTCGQPNYMSPTRSPLMCIGDVIPPVDAYVVAMILSLFLSGMTMWMFLIELDVSRCAAIVGSMVYMLSGYSIYFLPLLHYTEATAALPLVLLSIRRIGLGRRSSQVLPLSASQLAVQCVLLAFSFAWICLSRKDVAILTPLIAGPYGLYLAWHRPKGAWRGVLAMGGAAASCGVLLSTFEVGPYSEILSVSPRIAPKAFAFGDVATSLRSLILASVGSLSPDVFGDPSILSDKLPYHYKPYWGILPTLFILFGFSLGAESLFFLTMLAASFLLAANTPLRGLVVTLFPPLGYFDAYRCFWLTLPCAPVLCALGFDRIAAAPNDKTQSEKLYALMQQHFRTVVVIMTLIIAGLCLASPARLRPVLERTARSRFEKDTLTNQDRFPVTVRIDSYMSRIARIQSSLLRTSSLCLLCLGLILGLRNSSTGGRHRFFVLTCFILLIDLVPFAARYLPWGPRKDLYPPTEAIKYLQAQEGSFRVLPLGYTISPNSASMYDLECVNGYESLKLGSYPRLWVALGGESGHGLDMHQYPMDEAKRRALQMMGVRYVLSRDEIPASGLLESYSNAFHIYEDPGAFELIHVYEKWDWVSTEQEALKQLLDQAYDLRNQAIIETDRTLSPEAAQGETSPPDTGIEKHATVSSRIIQRGSDHMFIRVKVRQRSLVFLSIRNLPGWHALVDGKSAQIEKVNHSFMGVFVNPGDHVVTLYYSFASLQMGRWLAIFLSAISLLILAADAVASRDRIKRDPGPTRESTGRPG